MTIVMLCLAVLVIHASDWAIVGGGAGAFGLLAGEWLGYRRERSPG
jgi:hypothetical protein